MAPFTLATGLSLTLKGELAGALLDLAGAVGAWEATCDLALPAAASSRAKTTRYLIVFPPFVLKKRGREDPLSPRNCYASHWKTVGMLLVLLASFASPKWHW